ncbi:MAG: magnesium transporter [Bacillota bacterium]
MLLTKLRQADAAELVLLFTEELPADLAEAMAALSTEELIELMTSLEPALLAPVLEEMDYAFAAELLLQLPRRRATELIGEMASDDATDLLTELPPEEREEILEALNGQASPIRALLGYEEDTSGGIMATEFLAVRPEWTSEKALEAVRKTAQRAETAYYVYVTDEDQRLLGVLSLRELILAAPNALISEIMHEDPLTVRPEDDQEAVAALFRRHHLHALPVVDEGQVMQGVITGDDIIIVVDEEATEDIERMAALQPSDTPYLATPAPVLARQRLLWLSILMISATFTGKIIDRFQGVLSEVLLLAAFIPMLMDSGGNAGSQAATLVIRGLALGEIQARDWWKVIRSELKVGVLTGLGLALINFSRVVFISHYPLDIALVTSSTLIAAIIIAKLTGGLFPLAAKALRLDPAIMAAPLITTIVDALTLLVYFTLASRWLSI